VHSIQYAGKERVLIMQNGNPAKALIINTANGKIEKEIPIRLRSAVRTASFDTYE